MTDAEAPTRAPKRKRLRLAFCHACKRLLRSVSESADRGPEGLTVRVKCRRCGAVSEVLSPEQDRRARELARAFDRIARAALMNPNGIIQDVFFKIYPLEAFVKMRDDAKRQIDVQERIKREEAAARRGHSRRRRRQGSN